MLAASDEENKKRCMKAYREEKRKVDNSNKKRMEMGGWYWKRLKYEGFGSIISV